MKQALEWNGLVYATVDGSLSSTLRALAIAIEMSKKFIPRIQNSNQFYSIQKNETPSVVHNVRHLNVNDDNKSKIKSTKFKYSDWSDRMR